MSYIYAALLVEPGTNVVYYTVAIVHIPKAFELEDIFL